MAIQTNLVPDRAADVVVHPTPGIGDTTTIADAVSLIKSTGGRIFLRAGTYSLTAPVTLPAGVSIDILGNGPATIIDVSSHAIAAFASSDSTPGGPFYKISFTGFKITGNETTGQIGFQYNDSQGLAEIFFERVNTEGIETVVSCTAGVTEGGNNQDSTRIHMFRCRFRPNSTNTTVIIDNPGTGYPRVWMREVQLIGDSIFNVPGVRVDPLFGRIVSDVFDGDLYMVDCEMSVGGGGAGAGEGDFATFSATNTTIWNNDSTHATITYFLFGSFISGPSGGLGPGAIQGCTFNGIFFNTSDATIFSATEFTNCVLQLFGRGTEVSSCYFFQAGSVYPVSNISTLMYVIQCNNETITISNNKFKLGNFGFTTGAGGNTAEVIDVEVPVAIIGNDFQDVFFKGTYTAPPPSSTNGANGILFLNNATCIVLGNRFRFAPTTCPNINDTQGSSYYADNSQLFTNKTGGGPIVDPIIGGGSIVQGTLDANTTFSTGGTATNQLLVWYRNPFGLAQTKGYFKNTGSNNITVREQYITKDLGTFSRSTVVAAGGIITLDPFDFTGLDGSIEPQVIDYRVDVSGTTISGKTYFACPGGVSYI